MSLEQTNFGTVHVIFVWTINLWNASHYWLNWNSKMLLSKRLNVFVALYVVQSRRHTFFLKKKESLKILPVNSWVPWNMLKSESCVMNYLWHFHSFSTQATPEPTHMTEFHLWARSFMCYLDLRKTQKWENIAIIEHHGQCIIGNVCPLLHLVTW